METVFRKAAQIDDPKRVIRESTVEKIPRFALIISLFLVSTSLFMFEFLLTRVFSPMLRYHFVFMITSMAIFGLGIGGISAYFLGKKFSDTELDYQLPGWLIILASSYILSFSLIYKLPFLNQFVVYSAIASLPFIAGGVFISLVFMKMSAESHKLYFADLAGAGIGSIVVIQFINNMGIVNTVLIASSFSVVSSLIISIFLSKKKQMVITICAVIILAIIGTFQQGIKQFERRFTGYFTSPVTSLQRLRSSNITHRLEDWIWDSFSRTDVIENLDDPGGKIVTIDGGSNSTMFRFDGDLNKLQALKSDLNYFPFVMGKNNKILLIGSGGGKDILLALLAGSKNIDAVEINRGTVKMADKYAEYNGWIYDREEVDVFIQDGRNFVKQTQEQYDHIYLAQVISDAAGAVGYSLAENFIYTTEAIEDYWEALADNGRLTFILHDDRDMTRLILTVSKVLEKIGVKQSQISQHFVIINNGDHVGQSNAIHMPVVVIKKSPFTQFEIIKLLNLIKTSTHKPLHLPYVAGGNFFTQLFLMEEKGDSFSNSTMLNLEPTTDNRPYFFDFDRGINYILLTLLGGTLLIGLILFKPIFNRNNLLRSPYYFAGLGFGFMLIEIPMIQKFTLFLGHPTRAFVIILVALLTGGGIGSLLGGWKKLYWKNRYLPLVLIPLLTVLIYGMHMGLMDRWLISTMAIRIFITFIMIFPLGFFMGMPFPMGIKVLKQKNYENTVPLMLGLNGTMSIGGSVLAVIISMKFGLSYSLATGGLIYLLLFLSMPIYEKGWKVV
jgi:spermidine synthase